MAANNGIASADQRKVPVLSSVFAQRFSNKMECYRFVAQECSIALDDYRVVSVFHLRDIVEGNRKTIKQADLKHIHVPQFPGLNLESMLEFAEKYPEVFQVLPRENSEIMQLHRQYVANVIYTIAGDDFTDWLNRKLKQRNKKIAEERNLNIKMDPEIYRHFKASESISGK